jgi:hypothetical protein
MRVKSKSAELYVQAKSGAKIFHDARVPLGLAVAPEHREKQAVEHMIKVWRYFSDPSTPNDSPEFQGVAGALPWNVSLERRDVVAHVARNVVDRLSERIT